MGIFDRLRGDSVRVHLVIKGRFGEEWRDIDEYLRLPAGTTLAQLIEQADKGPERVPLKHSLENSPHLKDTMMLNGERCPVAENGERVLVDGDEIFLLSPLAGG